MKNLLPTIAALVSIALLSLAGCATSNSTDPTATSGKTDTTSDSPVVYFEFDSSELDRAGRDAIDSHTGYLASNSNATVFVQGHADERGTLEYNESLGERRAQTVARVLRAKGINGKRIRIVSFGEALPASNGHDEESWARNRRVEIVLHQ